MISVIVPTYNSWLTLKPCLDSLLEQTLPPAEIIVVDNGSTDLTSKNIRKYFPNIKLIQLPNNTGVTGGRNAGILSGNPKSKYIFFFDHDMTADPKMLQELLEIAESSKNIGIVTPKIFYLSDKHLIWSAGTGINLWTGQVLFRGGPDSGRYEKVAEVQVAPAAMLVKREVLNFIKGFDNRYFATYEDTDFCFRARKMGFKTYYAPRAVAYHDLSTDPRDEAKRLLSRAYFVGKNRVMFMKDFAVFFPIFLLFIPFYSLYYLRLAIRYHQTKSWINFIKGTLSGLIT